MRPLLSLLLVALSTAAQIPAKQNVSLFQCVEFPYIQFPRPLWERELVWMKNIGVESVALSVPGDWTPADPNPNHDLQTLLRTLHKLGLTAWVKPERENAQLSQWIDLQRESHGGPVVYFGVDQAPQPVHRVSMLSPSDLSHRREWMAVRHGTLWWTDVESITAPEFHAGAVSLAGEESGTVPALRKDLALLHYWGATIGMLKTERLVRPAGSRFPSGVHARQFVGEGNNPASALSVVNESKGNYEAELRVYYPPAKREIVLPPVHVPANTSLWLPVNLPLAKDPFCRQCDAFSSEDSLIYATAELTGIEYENGILAMEFTAPLPGEAVLHLAQEPNGPFLAAGTPREFEWDKATGRLKLMIPAGAGPSRRVRIGIALDAPEHSAYFGDTKVLISGQKNRIATHYSSAEVAQRSRLQAPAWLSAKAIPDPQNPLEIDYELSVPADALHGDHVELALLENGEQLGHTRLQILRGASLRVRETINRHFAAGAELATTPPLVSIPQNGGRNITVTLRNNHPEIRNYVLQLSGEGVSFSPPKTEISVGASAQRDISVRVFADEISPGLHGAKITLSGAENLELEAKMIVIPRGETVAYSADLLGDGRTEYVLETQKTRAVFSGPDQNHWLEFVWKAEEKNLLPTNGIDLGLGSGHKITLRDSELIVEQSTGFPGKFPPATKLGNLLLQVQRPSATAISFQIHPE